MPYLTVKRALSNLGIIPVAVTLLCLIPFAGKAFHLDDPMFIWAAQQIQENPADFRGFTVNWYGTEMPASAVEHNPPAFSYYIAPVGSIFGWNEIVLHITCLIPAAAAALGTYYLARELCSMPTLAALAAVLTPGFLVSSSNVMCDTMTLALWVWAVVLWMWGMKTNRGLSLFFSAILIGLCALTKYIGAALVVVLFIYSLMQRRKLGSWALWFLIPVGILSGYQLAAYLLYGHGPLSSAAAFATELNLARSSILLSKGLMGLAFVGGCIITTLFYIPLLWSRRVLVSGIVITCLLIFGLSFAEKVGATSIRDDGSVRWGFLVQLVLMVMGGVSLLGLCVTDFWKNRDAESLLLVLWVIGIFIFVSFANWVINARSILPMVPAAGILLMRRIESRIKISPARGLWRVSWPLIGSAAFALLVCWADYSWANTAREAAGVIDTRFEKYAGNIWFQGHWGFQYYMEEKGHKAHDFKYPKVKSGDIIIIPSNNTSTRLFDKKVVSPVERYEFVPCRWLATMNRSVGAGFYADVWGALPFAIGPVRPEEYYVFTVN